MARYVIVRLTVPQALAAANACDMVRDSLDADDRKRDAACYRRASDIISREASKAVR
jgi:hypothetical protein